MTDVIHSLADALTSAGESLLQMRDADVGRSRESSRRARFVKITFAVWALVALMLWRGAYKSPGSSWIPFPHVDPFLLVIIGFFALMVLMLVGQQMVTGKSPHVVYRADQIQTRMSDVVGIDPIKSEVVRSLNLFLAHKTYSGTMGGSPRRGLLFEGPPGTGKTHLARAMAAEAGVPFLFVSGTAFQTVWQGQSGKKIRNYFKALRKAALREGGAIGFIEEIDVIAQARSGVSAAFTPAVISGCSGTTCLPSTYAQPAGLVTNGFAGSGDSAGIINELLVQMQSFDALTGSQKLAGWFVDKLNLLLPLHRQVKRPAATPANILLIAATNRASTLDPALLRPGRFDFLISKNHDAELDEDEKRDALAAICMGYSPVMLENLFDEGLISAVRRGSTSMSWEDVEHARLSIDVGLGQPVEYTDHERRLIATHEAGHATTAWLKAPQRRLEVLTIIKRKGSLGLLAHGDREDVYTRSRSEMEALVQIAMGGQCAEELFFGDVSTGPGGDLLYATNTAAEMIGAHGMEDSLISYLAVQNGAFNDTNIVGRVLADERGRDAVEKLLQKHKAVTRQLLSENRHLVEALRDALLEHDELIGHAITDVLEAAAAGPATIDLRDPSELPTA
jgi:cell division protease FtsH